MIYANIISASLHKEVIGGQVLARSTVDVALIMSSNEYRKLNPNKPVYITQEPDALAKAWAEGHEQGMNDVGRQITDRHYSGHTKNPYQA